MKSKVLLFLLIAVFLAACAGSTKATPTPLPTVILGSGNPVPSSESAGSVVNINSDGVRAAGIIVPAQKAQLAATIPGTVQTVHVELGDQVNTGDVLITLSGGEAYTAAVQGANLELLSAQQALKTLQDNTDQAKAAAQLRLANAQKALEEAEKHRTWRNYRNGSQSTIEAAQADLILAKDALDNAEKGFEPFSDSPADDINRAAALSILANARKAYDRALANLNYLLAMPDQVDVDKAEAELQAAKAELENAQNDLDKMADGPDADALALAEARLSNAQAQFAASKAALNELEIKAPFAGTISRVDIHNGEWVMPGQMVLVLADLSSLLVETTDLGERDVPAVKIGQNVTVLIKPLDLEINGTVKDISPLADTLGGDVVYKTVIELKSHPEYLRAGMSVDVFFTGP